MVAKGKPMTTLQFKMNWTKAVEAIHFVVSLHPGITPYYLVKIFYFADKAHLADWGRPICGDDYVAMEHGPVPSGIYDLVKRDVFLDDDIIAEFDHRVREEGRALHPEIPFDRVSLSPSDVECLQNAEKIYAHMSFGALREHVHHERAWADAWETRQGLAARMDMAKMIDEDVPDRDGIIEEIKAKAAYAL
jgi:uncharacterized phage-associated protein